MSDIDRPFFGFLKRVSEEHRQEILMFGQLMGIRTLDQILKYTEQNLSDQEVSSGAIDAIKDTLNRDYGGLTLSEEPGRSLVPYDDKGPRDAPKEPQFEEFTEEREGGKLVTYRLGDKEIQFEDNGSSLVIEGKKIDFLRRRVVNKDQVLKIYRSAIEGKSVKETAAEMGLAYQNVYQYWPLSGARGTGRVSNSSQGSRMPRNYSGSASGCSPLEETLPSLVKGLELRGLLGLINDSE